MKLILRFFEKHITQLNIYISEKFITAEHFATTKIYYEEENVLYIIFLMIYLANQAQYYPINQLSPTTITVLIMCVYLGIKTFDVS